MNQRQRKKLSRRLFEAIVMGDAARVQTLLRAGADPQRADAEGATPLYQACVSGQADVARLLLEAGAAPDAESGGPGSEGTPLCAAACWGHTETVRALLAYGADPRLREDHGTGRTPLEWAMDAGPHTGTADLLIAAGAGAGSGTAT
ncbi:ankyrin repeat domain-containing protein [Streptomyces tubbatahanensis]|uniref:Ankyrin repeat domain-containing protein n=1 Tax=Streptomyces tubbatahanensis TaxID=2923272 RepID=A0ABY3XLL2_9ACTN|nr:ankyrin repeat domain-containing protein [Streptomyces tubbatahanensis]UNS95303.1 ankyrin repeat domain-containing protein [Streptomyces tubbatahanensis]